MATAGKFGAVADGVTPLGGKQINYTSPAGSRSDVSLAGNQLDIQIRPPIDVGRPGESRVLACITAYLRQAGTQSIELPASDQLGEDGVLQISGERVTVQIVTVRRSSNFWGSVARGSGEVQVELSEAVNWIHTAVTEKANLYPTENKSSMLLAIDVGHMGVLASAALVTAYLEIHGDPSACFQFGAVWLVGPTESNVVVLGISKW
jgi:hypothetical protein